jgi:hypothetical protein
MTRKLLVFMTVAALLILAGTAISADLTKTMPMPAKQKLLTGDEIVPNVQYVPSSSIVTDSPGEIIGASQYDYQSNGSSGRRVVVDSQGGLHFAWMNGHPYPGTRHIYFNCISSTGSPFPGVGQQVSFRNRDGYTQIAITNDDRAAIVYHNAATTGAESLFIATDASTCLGAFDYHRIPNRLGGGNTILWPYIAVDRTGNIHVVASTTTATAGTPAPVGYTRSTDDGLTWAALQRVDTLEDISYNVIASKVSNKVAIIYTHPHDSSQWREDIMYVQSSDGLTWDFRNGKVNVTHYGQNGDSLWAYTDLAGLYDYNDDLHLVWNGQFISPSSGGIYYGAKMIHYDVSSGTFTEFAQFDSTWPSAGCGFGVWNWTFGKMSLAVDFANNLYCTYTSWDTSDCSAAGFANGDIYLQYSTDHGASWTAKMNLTNSQTPGCAAGDCDSDHWSCLAEKADTALHLFYVNDKDAGGVPQTEGVATDNPMMYLHYVAPPLLGVNENNNMPKDFSLSQNYPNPFNARTNINFDLNKDSRVELYVFDITGAKVATLINNRMSAGAHQVTWDANSIPSGVYYYTLKANGTESTKKMTLLK